LYEKIQSCYTKIMPKIVDHDARRVELAEAAWRVIRRHGLEGASVRNVAREAGMSIGSLRHYFSSQDELLAFSMNMVGERVKERIKNIRMTGDIRADLTTIIEETLPLDEDKISEAIIWLGFMTRALVDPALEKMAPKVHDALFQLFRSLVDAAKKNGAITPEKDVDQEARRMHALVDGLVIHALTNPGSVTKETIRRTVAYHLDELLDGMKGHHDDKGQDDAGKRSSRDV